MEKRSSRGTVAFGRLRSGRVVKVLKGAGAGGTEHRRMTGRRKEARNRAGSSEEAAGGQQYAATALAAVQDAAKQESPAVGEMSNEQIDDARQKFLLLFK